MSEQNVMEQQIQILSCEEAKLVEKPWGWERWIADAEPSFRYALKQIFIRAPYKSSIQFHKDKQETNYVQKGRAILHYSAEPIDLDAYLNGRYSEDKIAQIIASLKSREIVPGMVFHVFPGFIHRVEAIEDLTMIEVSTTELDDVYRLQDDSGRGHGRIESEHQHS